MHTILVIDDEPSLVALTARMLELEGYAPVPLQSPPLALAFLAGGGACDLLIADVRMPAMSGFELAQCAHRRRPELPVLFISGYVESDYAGDGGFHDFLAKPFTQEQLLTAVRRLLAAPSRPDMLEQGPAPTLPVPPRAIVLPS